MRCYFDTNEKLKAAGSPHYIRGEPFSTDKLLKNCMVLEQPVNVDQQKSFINDMLTEDQGWTAFVCGLPETTRLFAYSMMRHYSESTRYITWHHVTASKWDKLIDARDKPILDMIVLDSLLTHPPMHPNASRAYDPTRIGKIFDIVASYRGRSSILILCPELDPEEAFKISSIQPEFMLYLKGKQKDIEL